MVFPIEIGEEDTGRCGELGAGGETHDADLLRVDAPLRGTRPRETDRLHCVADGVDFGDVAVVAQPIAQDDGVDAVVVEIRDEVPTLRADVERAVSAAGDDDDRGPVLVPGSTVCTSIDGLWMLTMLWIRPGTPFVMLYCSASRTRDALRDGEPGV